MHVRARLQFLEQIRFIAHNLLFTIPGTDKDSWNSLHFLEEYDITAIFRGAILRRQPIRGCRAGSCVFKHYVIANNIIIAAI